MNKKIGIIYQKTCEYEFYEHTLFQPVAYNIVTNIRCNDGYGIFTNYNHFIQMHSETTESIQYCFDELLLEYITRTNHNVGYGDDFTYNGLDFEPFTNNHNIDTFHSITCSQMLTYMKHIGY